VQSQSHYHRSWKERSDGKIFSATSSDRHSSNEHSGLEHQFLRARADFSRFSRIADDAWFLAVSDDWMVGFADAFDQSNS
jgi:hypothetical protein